MIYLKSHICTIPLPKLAFYSIAIEFISNDALLLSYKSLSDRKSTILKQQLPFFALFTDSITKGN